MHLRHTNPSRLFHVTGGGAGLDPTHTCAHGSPSVSFHLLSDHDGKSDDIGILLPMCAAPALFGAAVAFVDDAMGADEGDEFMASVQAAREHASRQITAAKTAKRAAAEACCEAGYRTQNREHTCDRGTPTASEDNPA